MANFEGQTDRKETGSKQKITQQASLGAREGYIRASYSRYNGWMDCSDQSRVAFGLDRVRTAIEQVPYQLRASSKSSARLVGTTAKHAPGFWLCGRMPSIMRRQRSRIALLGFASGVPLEILFSSRVMC